MSENEKKDGAEGGERSLAPQEAAQGGSQGAAAQPNGKGVFAAVVGRLARPEELLSLDGCAGRGEYWATYLVVVLPLVALWGIAYGIGVLSDYVQTHAVCVSIAGGASVLANLVFLPVMVRRARDLALPPWAALALTVVCSLPYAKWLGMVAVVVLGCLGSKAGPAEGGAKLTPRLACLYWLIAVTLASMGAGRLGYSLCDDADKRMNKELKDFDRSFDGY